MWRDQLGDGAPVATAIFLSWDYEAVVFAAQCDKARHALRLRYMPDKREVTLATADGQTSSPDETLAIIIGHREMRMQTTADQGALTGMINARLLIDAMRHAPGVEIGIAAPNPLGDPWGVGSAGALRRLAESCL